MAKHLQTVEERIEMGLIIQLAVTLSNYINAVLYNSFSNHETSELIKEIKDFVIPFYSQQFCDIYKCRDNCAICKRDLRYVGNNYNDIVIDNAHNISHFLDFHSFADMPKCYVHNRIYPPIFSIINVMKFNSNSIDLQIFGDYKVNCKLKQIDKSKLINNVYYLTRNFREKDINNINYEDYITTLENIVNSKDTTLSTSLRHCITLAIE